MFPRPDTPPRPSVVDHYSQSMYIAQDTPRAIPYRDEQPTRSMSNATSADAAFASYQSAPYASFPPLARTRQASAIAPSRASMASAQLYHDNSNNANANELYSQQQHAASFSDSLSSFDYGPSIFTPNAFGPNPAPSPHPTSLASMQQNLQSNQSHQLTQQQQQQQQLQSSVPYGPAPRPQQSSASHTLNDRIASSSQHYNPSYNSTNTSAAIPRTAPAVPTGSMSAAGQPSNSTEEEISTIFVVGFPDDMQEREFQNMFTFSLGFEAATLKMPNKDSFAQIQQNQTAPLRSGAGSFATGSINDPYSVESSIIAPGANGPTSATSPTTANPTSASAGWPGLTEDAFVTRSLAAGLANATLPQPASSVNDPSSSANNPSFGNSATLPPGVLPRRQIIGFAKFATRHDAIAARDTLQGKRVDVEKGAVLKAEMAKKNLHTKRGVGPLGPGALASGTTHVPVSGTTNSQQASAVPLSIANVPGVALSSNGTTTTILGLGPEAVGMMGGGPRAASSGVGPGGVILGGIDAAVVPLGRRERDEAALVAMGLPTEPGVKTRLEVERERERAMSGSDLSVISNGYIPHKSGPPSVAGSVHSVASSASSHVVPSGPSPTKSTSSVALSTGAAPAAARTVSPLPPPLPEVTKPLMPWTDDLSRPSSPSAEPDYQPLEPPGQEKPDEPAHAVLSPPSKALRPDYLSDEDEGETTFIAPSPPRDPYSSRLTQASTGSMWKHDMFEIVDSQVREKDAQSQRHVSYPSSASTTSRASSSSRGRSPEKRITSLPFLPQQSDYSVNWQNPRNEASSLDNTTSGGGLYRDHNSHPGRFPSSSLARIDDTYDEESIMMPMGDMSLYEAHDRGRGRNGELSPQLPSPEGGSGLRNNVADQNPPINTLYVGNLPTTATNSTTNLLLEENLRLAFSKCPGYRKLCFRQKSNGPMCFVEFDDVHFATRALQDMYGHTLNGLIKNGIRLSYSKNPLGVRSPSMSNGGPVDGRGPYAQDGNIRYGPNHKPYDGPRGRQPFGDGYQSPEFRQTGGIFSGNGPFDGGRGRNEYGGQSFDRFTSNSPPRFLSQMAQQQQEQQSMLGAIGLPNQNELHNSAFSPIISPTSTAFGSTASSAFGFPSNGNSSNTAFSPFSTELAQQGLMSSFGGNSRADLGGSDVPFRGGDRDGNGVRHDGRRTDMGLRNDHARELNLRNEMGIRSNMAAAPGLRGANLDLDSSRHDGMGFPNDLASNRHRSDIGPYRHELAPGGGARDDFVVRDLRHDFSVIGGGGRNDMSLRDDLGGGGGLQNHFVSSGGGLRGEFGLGAGGGGNNLNNFSNQFNSFKNQQHQERSDALYNIGSDSRGYR